MNERHAQGASTPVWISRSSVSTRVNKTGDWRYVRPFYEEKTAPCTVACPAGTDIAAVQMLTAQAAFARAAQCILEENPFPAVCGYVCDHPCTAACNRATLDAPLGIERVERFLGTWLLGHGREARVPTAAPNGRRVAIAGAGPAGLAAAYFLARLGYACDVSEARAAPGGLLRWGIPAYRLPPRVLTSEIERITALGVRIACGQAVDGAFAVNGARGYDAVFVACGHGRPLALGIPGEVAAEDGLALLARLRAGATVDVAGRAAVIGGGNSAVDVARCLLRLGAEPMIVYRRRREDMPACTAEIDLALEEGVQLMERHAPTRLAATADGLTLTVQPTAPGSPDPATGRTPFVPLDGPLQSLRVRHVFTAVGAGADPAWEPPAGSGEALKLSHCTLAAGARPVVYGGDLTNRRRRVIDAVASGKQAALVIDACLQGGRERVAATLQACRVGPGEALSMEAHRGGARRSRSARVVRAEEINGDYFAAAAAVEAPLRAVGRRRRDFGITGRTVSPAGAVQEARRCYNCGRCNACDNCRRFCPDVAVRVDGERRTVDLDYCKGCGICVTECPRNAMSLAEEAS